MAHPLVVHLRKSPYDVRIDRQTAWGNPFSHKEGTTAKWKVGSRNESIDQFREWLLTSDDFKARWMREHIGELRGKVLGCWCAPQRCHGEVLAELANQERD